MHVNKIWRKKYMKISKQNLINSAFKSEKL